MDLREAPGKTISLTAGDKLELHELMYKLHYAIDRGEAAALAAVFAEDGIFVVRDESQVVQKEVVGRAEIEKFAVVFTDSAPEDAKHFLTNLVVFPHAEDVRIVGYILKVHVANKPTPVASATDECLARKIDGTWYLSRFDHYIDTIYPNSKIA